MVALPTARAPFNSLNVTPGLYSHPGLVRDPYAYVPGETLTFTIVAGATEVYDAVVVVCTSVNPPCTTATVLQGYDDQVIPAGGTLTLSYIVPATLQDGIDYRVEIGFNNWIQSNRGCCHPAFGWFRNFAVQAYEVRLDVDRVAYLGGDNVTVTWSVNNLKGGSLAPVGFGQLWAYDANNVLFVPVHSYNEPSSSFQFRLPNLADPRFDGTVHTWFNDTTSNPIRSQEKFTNFAIDSLGVLVNVNPSQYAPGGIVNTYVTTVVTTNQASPSPFDPPEPNIDVSITVWQIMTPPNPPVERTQYRNTTALETDAHGQLTYVFKLDANIPSGTDFEVRASASHKNGIWNWQALDTFTVSAAAGITQVLTFNQIEYQAGDTATVTSTVRGAGTAPITYIFEVRDTTSSFCSVLIPAGTLLGTSTQAQSSYSYLIDRNFMGQICFRVTADDGQGNRVTSAQAFSVVFGWLLVNADRQEYNPTETVTISWELKSNRINPAAATYYFEVRDRDGNLVQSGTTGTGRTFQFPVPNPASPLYSFSVTATQDGRTVSGSVSLSQVRGFFITATFDRSSYSPGDDVHVHYKISARSADSILPSTFRITYGLLNGPPGGSTRVLATGSAEGDLTYTVPKGIDEGAQIFIVGESNTGTQALETITVRGTDPLWFVAVGDVPVIVILMLLWLVLITLLLWRKGVLGGLGMGGPRPAAPPGPSKPEPVHAPASMPMTVTCRSCGSPIEITTSKRPIEVMCPKCGNTELVA